MSSVEEGIAQEARELNESLRGEADAIFSLLSRRGRRTYMPRKGIISQAAEARTVTMNATVAVAYGEDHKLLHLNMDKLVNLPPEEVFPYAPPAGVARLRKKWKESILEKSPSLGGKRITLPVVVSGITGGLTVLARLMADEGDQIIIPAPFWGNYRQIFETSWGLSISPFLGFESGRFDIGKLREQLFSPGKKKLLLLNFPHNPTGFTPSVDEAHEIAKTIREAAEEGKSIAVFLDDAYFGFFYEEGLFRESLFALLADLHENVLVSKVDGATKEDYAWGFRVAFLTHAFRGMGETAGAVLENKTIGAVRGSLSNTSHLSQTLLLRSYSSETYQEEKRSKAALISERYRDVQELLAQHPEWKRYFEPYTFNSGYFMSLKLKPPIEAPVLRGLLVREFDIGTVSIGKDTLRISFASLSKNQIPLFYDRIYQACRRLEQNGGNAFPKSKS